MVDEPAASPRRRHSATAVVSLVAVIALLVGLAPGAAATPNPDPVPSLGGGDWGDVIVPEPGSGTPDPGTIVYGDDARVVVDGPDQPDHPAGRDRGAGAAAVLAAAAGGYQLLHPDLGIAASYQIRLVTDHPSWTAMTPMVNAAISQLQAATGVAFTLGPTRPDHTDALTNEISISLYTSPPCEGAFVGCTDVHAWSWNGSAPYFVSAARIWVDPGYLGHPDVFSEILVHELGHAAGLDHYDASFEGLPQVMRSYVDLPLVGGYRSGDRNGLARTAAIGALVPAPCFPGIIDVGEDNVFCPDITWALEEGLATGYTDGSFRPLDALTRQGAAIFLHRLAGSPTVPDDAPRFSDVSPSHPFGEAIRWLAWSGISTGYVDGTFQPAVTLSRQAMAAFLQRMYDPAPESYVPIFSDVPADHIFFDAISWLAAAGITNGDASGRFNPTALVTRQVMAAYLHRYDALPPL